MDSSLEWFTYRQVLHTFSVYQPIEGLWNCSQEKLSTIILAVQPWLAKSLLTFVSQCAASFPILFGNNLLHFHWGISLSYFNPRKTVNRGQSWWQLGGHMIKARAIRIFLEIFLAEVCGKILSTMKDKRVGYQVLFAITVVSPHWESR